MRLTLATVSIVDDGCFSVLLDENKIPRLVTIERTFDDGRPILPGGVFVCKRRRFNRGGYMTHEVTGIEGHSLILFHKGNVETDSLGCLLTGTKFGFLSGKPAVLESRFGFEAYWAIAGGVTEYELEVVGR